MTYKNSSASVRPWLESGLAEHRRGNLDQAVRAYREALSRAPDDADALNLLGTGLLQIGEAQEATHCLERASRKQRGNPMLLANLAQGYIALKRYSDAYDAFRKANRIDPRELQFQLGMATTLALQRKFSDAELLLQRLSARFPQSALVWFNTGNVLRDQQRPDEAISAYGRALAIDPEFADAINNLGSVYQSTLRFAEAEAQYRRCLTVDANHLQARFNLASVVMDLGRFDEAEQISRELLARAPNVSEAHTILGAAVGHQGRLLEALACYERAARVNPSNEKTLETYAATLIETQHTVPGLRWFSKALALSSEPQAPRQLLGTALLAGGYLQDGWREYQARPAARRFREKYSDLHLTNSLAADITGKHICILREQGLGDELFFLRYAARLAASRARLTYRASTKLLPMLSRLNWIDRLVEDVSDLPSADANILLGDLPHALGELPRSPLAPLPLEHVPGLPDFARSTAVFWPTVPASISLEPLSAKVDEARKRLEAAGPAPYIGLTWRAGTPPEEQNSVTWLLYKAIGLETLGEALQNVNGTLVALQRQPGRGELAALSQAVGSTVHDFTAYNDDLESMLALLSVMDDYVAVSNTNVHLRAALGKTARILVPTPTEWRWMQSGDASPWFPGFSIYRQSLQGDWSYALMKLKADLQVNYASGTKSNGR